MIVTADPDRCAIWRRAKGRTSAAISRLVGLQAKSARVVRDGQAIDVPLEDARWRHRAGAPRRKGSRGW